MARRRHRKHRRHSGKGRAGKRVENKEENDIPIQETPNMSLIRLAKSVPVILEKNLLNGSLNNLNMNTPERSFKGLNQTESKNSKNLNLLFAKVENQAENYKQKGFGLNETSYLRKIDNNLLETFQVFDNKLKNNCEVVKIDVATQTVQYEKNSIFLNHSSMPSFAQIFETPKNNGLFEINFSPKLSSSSTPIMNINNGFMLKFAEKRALIDRKKQILRHASPNSNCFNFNKRFSINKPRLYKSLSPKINKSSFVEFSTEKRFRPGVPAAVGDYKIPKSFSPIKRTSIRCNENFMNVRGDSKFGKIFSHIRNFNQKYSRKCLNKLFEVCAWLGVVMKEGFDRLYELSWVRNKGVQVNQEYGCKDVKGHLEMIYKLLEKLSGDIDEVKKKVGSGGGVCQPSPGTVVIPPPPPPPPALLTIPPPPPPPMPLPKIDVLVKKNTKKQEVRKEENERPVISVDALKSVKLKKPSERVNRSLNTLRRTSQPAISLEMLKQVKLRPAARGSASSSLSEAASSALASSPVSSLTKLLAKGGDSSVKRLKRLKRTNTYSSNLDFFRTPQGSPRERERFQN